MSKSSSYTSEAEKALNILTSKWFTSETPLNWVGPDYWRTPTICLLLIDAMKLFNNSNYVNTLVNSYNAGKMYTTSCGYYDDLSVWGRMYTHGYKLFTALGLDQNATNFLNEAKAVNSQLEQGADSICGGGDWWKRDVGDPKNFKASNSTIGWAETAIDLYNITKDDKYLNNAKTAMQWVISKDLIASNGAVWGGLGHQSNCSVAQDNPPVIALQGNPLAPLWDLYIATKDSAYLTAAQNCVDWAMQNKTFPNTQLFLTKEDNEWNSKPYSWQENNSGPCLFKGIFSRYLAQFTINLFESGNSTLVAKSKDYATIIKKNADIVLTNYPSYIFGMNWNIFSPNNQPTSNDQLNASLQYSGCSILLAAIKTEPILNNEYF
ncbi:glycoside hydrolase family 76 protein [Aequorivita antarctica]|uniref:Glycosyl hydrolase n=1 Tax=Aequorivita antarctica TaxID=153266 RepID=A0A5C6YYS3_9FLAO|nr:glycoside hydrolase family 76 protein [Aequorivita antarctica]TXD72786.1 hypothetical protein ESU54_11235 [Aequorivita antarctica]SRX76214.1 hypothetical protein AEQU3_03213 [Aequorivita antarctica]